MSPRAETALADALLASLVEGPRADLDALERHIVRRVLGPLGLVLRLPDGAVALRLAGFHRLVELLNPSSLTTTETP